MTAGAADGQPHDVAVGRAELVALLMTLLAGLPMVTWPFGRDQGNYAYPAWRLLEGDVPYRDVYVFKPPGTMLLHALSQLLFGHDMAAIRVMDLSLLTVSAVGITMLARRWGVHRTEAALAGSLVPIVHVAGGFWHTAQTDPWFTPPAVVGLLLLSTRTLRARHAAMAGVLLGSAIVLKYTAVVLALPLTVALMLRMDLTLRDRLRLLGVAILCTSVVPLLTVLWLAASGGLDSFVAIQQEVLKYGNRGYSWGSARVQWRQLAASNRVVRYAPFVLVAGLIVSVARAFITPATRVPTAILLSWTVALVVSVAAQARFFLYHWLCLTPVIALAGTALIGRPWARLTRSHPRVRLAGLIVVLLGLANMGARRSDGWPNVWSALVDRDAQVRGFKSSAIHGRFERFVDAAEHMAELTEPDETVFLFGFDPTVLFLARRRQATRFLYSFPVLNAWAGPTPAVELEAALRAEPPKVIVLESRDAAVHVTGQPADSRAWWHHHARLQHFLEWYYLPLDEREEFAFYLRNERPFPTDQGTPRP